MRAKLRCGVEISLAKRRPPTTPSPPRKRNFQAECFQHLYRRLPDMRFVVANECIVPENDLAAVVAVVVDRGAYSIFLKPAIETFLGVFRQCAFRRKPNGFFHQNAQGREFESRIGQPRHGTTNSAKNIRPAKNALAQAQSMSSMSGLEQFRFQKRQAHG